MINKKAQINYNSPILLVVLLSEHTVSKSMVT